MRYLYWENERGLIMNYDVITALLQSAQGFTGALDKDYVKLERAEQSSNDVIQLVSQIDGTMGLALDSLVATALSDAEEQGFINGFRMGAKLMMELNSPTTSHVK